MSVCKVVMLVPSREFRDEEYSVPREILEQGGCEITVASSSARPCRGRFGLEAKTDLILDEVKPEDYDAIVMVGGPGAAEYFRNPAAHRLVKDFFSQGKLLGAISTAPSILANAGVLKGRRATSYSSEHNILKMNEALLGRGSVEMDFNIITANGPEASKDFGEALLNKLMEAKVEGQ